jgi:hypothetical protein
MPSEHRPRRETDRQLEAAGWVFQDYDGIDQSAAQGVAVREPRPTDRIAVAEREEAGTCH